MKKKHGGKRKGAGRKPSPYISKNVKLRFESEEEYRLFMKLSTPRERVEVVLGRVMYEADERRGSCKRSTAKVDHDNN